MNEKLEDLHDYIWNLLCDLNAEPDGLTTSRATDLIVQKVEEMLKEKENEDV